MQVLGMVQMAMPMTTYAASGPVANAQPLRSQVVCGTPARAAQVSMHTSHAPPTTYAEPQAQPLHQGCLWHQTRQVPVSVEVVAGTAPPIATATTATAATATAGRYIPPHCPHRVATVANVEHLDPSQVYNLIREQKCMVVDLRGEDRAAGQLQGTINIPAYGEGSFMNHIGEFVRQWADQPLVIFMCQYSAHRAPQCANWYRQQAPPHQRVAILSGGFRGWESCGLPVQHAASGEQAREADELAMRIGTHFVHSFKAHQIPVQAYVKPSQTVTIHAPNAPSTGRQENGRQPETVMPQAVQLAPRPQSQPQPQPQLQLQPQAAVYVPPPCPNRVPTSINVQHLEPATVYNLMQENKCILVDLRGEDRASGLIEGSIHVPAIDTVPFPVKVGDLVRQWSEQSLVVFTCQYSAHRAPQCANWYRQKAPPNQQVAILSGGFRGWESQGLPVQALATGDLAQAADDAAMQLGTQFVQHLPANERPAHAREIPQKVSNGLPNTEPPALQPSRQPTRQADTKTSVPQVAQKEYVPPHLPNTVPTVRNVEHVDPPAAHDMLQNNQCILVDLRGEDRASGVIDGTIHEPAIDTVPFPAKVPKLVQEWCDAPFVIFTCQYSAHRAPQCANWYRQQAHPQQRVGILKGGFRGWEAVGLPVQSLATGEHAKAADEVAKHLGTQFVHGCLEGIPGGGFCMPGANSKTPTRQPTSQQTSKTVQSNANSVTNGNSHQVYHPQVPGAVPTIENVENFDPKTVHDMLISRQCLLVDLRGDDRAAGLIDGAIHEPAIDSVPFPQKVPQLVQKWSDQSLVVFSCQYSAHRAPQCANWYRQHAHPHQRVGILEGGFRNWEAMGLPVKALADGNKAAAADEAAKRLGAQCIDGYIKDTPGGGFGMPAGCQ